MESAKLLAEETRAERARAKLAAHLDILSAPNTYERFKDELKQDITRAKDDILSEAKGRARSTVEGWVDDLKAQASANPAATLMIGAGIAYRMLKSPPIASLLVGAGVYSLLKTPRRHRPNESEEYIVHAAARLNEQVSDLASAAATATGDAASIVSKQAGELANSIHDKADVAVASTGEALGAAGRFVVDAVAGVRDQTSRSMHDARDVIGREAGKAKEAVANAANSARDQLPTGSDGVLLAIAGIAVSAALGIAVQKKLAGQIGAHKIPLA
jgi:hypothetical protein